MTYTEKILAEFEKFSPENQRKNYASVWIAFEEQKLFLTTKLHQAEQEIEVKVRLEIFQMLHKRIMETKDLNQIDILELLQKELLDNLKE